MANLPFHFVSPAELSLVEIGILKVITTRETQTANLLFATCNYLCLLSGKKSSELLKTDNNDETKVINSYTCCNGRIRSRGSNGRQSD
jgi:hypothetical protein